MSSKNSKKKSFISELRSEGRINENFINIVSDLKLEELIAIKLEESANSTGGKFYNFPIWHSLPYICKDACYKFCREFLADLRYAVELDDKPVCEDNEVYSVKEASKYSIVGHHNISAKKWDVIPWAEKLYYGL